MGASGVWSVSKLVALRCSVRVTSELQVRAHVGSAQVEADCAGCGSKN